MSVQLDTTSPEETERLGEYIGKALRGGEVLELISDLGGGKTTFVRGLAAGMGSQAIVASPTFTIRREYKAGALTLYHFDFYRLDEPGIMAHELSEALQDARSVTVIEWGAVVGSVLPNDRLTIQFTPVEESVRSLSIDIPQTFSYVTEAIDAFTHGSH